MALFPKRVVVHAVLLAAACGEPACTERAGDNRPNEGQSVLPAGLLMLALPPQGWRIMVGGDAGCRRKRPGERHPLAERPALPRLSRRQSDPRSSSRIIGTTPAFAACVRRADIPRFAGIATRASTIMRQYNPSARTDQEAEYWTSGHGRRLKASAEGENATARSGGRHLCRLPRRPRHPGREECQLARLSDPRRGNLRPLPRRRKT